jgi:hypothetical protein
MQMAKKVKNIKLPGRTVKKSSRPIINDIKRFDKEKQISKATQGKSNSSKLDTGSLDLMELD